MARGSSTADAVALGLRIRRGRYLAGNLTQERLAACAGVSVRAIQKWEAGESAPRSGNLERLAECLGMTVEELTGVADTSGGDLLAAALEVLEEVRREREAVERLRDEVAEANRLAQNAKTPPA